MSKDMLINAIVPENVRVAIRNKGRLESFFEEFEREATARSNIYLGKVMNIEGSLEACFVDYGAERHGFLPMSEIRPSAWANKAQQGKPKIEQVMKRHQRVVVQVDKEAGGTKGARLTTFLSLAGRFMVLMPYSETRGVSRKIDDPEARKACREVAANLSPPKGMGLIVRTAGLGHGKRDLSRDLNFLIRLWKAIEQKAQTAEQPMLLHAEADLVQRILRDYYTTDVERVWIDDPEAYKRAEAFFKLYMPRQRQQLKAFREQVPIFSYFDIEEQIEAIHCRTVPLPSGGSLVIDQTEALVAVDVNSGKMKGQGSQEETAFETNKEAAKEIARQLTLRDLGGIIVIDFIDMTSAAKKTEVERALRDAMKTGKARHRIGKISTFGLCTLTRQRLGKSILAARHKECPTCHGIGVVADMDALSVRLLRKIRTAVATTASELIRVYLNPELANYFHNEHRALLVSCEKDCGTRIEVIVDPALATTEDRLETLGHSNTAPKPLFFGQDFSEEMPVDAEAAPEKARPKKKRRRRKKKPAEAMAVAQNDRETPADPDVEPSASETAEETAVETDPPTDSPKKKSAGSRRRRSTRKKKHADDAQVAGADKSEAADGERSEEKPASGKKRRRSRKKAKGNGEAVAQGPSTQPADPESPAPEKRRRRRRRRKKSDGKETTVDPKLKSEAD